MPRPKGRKNNLTLLKEAETKKALKLCEGHALAHAPDIVLAMANKAKEGDVAAAKLILDRVMPSLRQTDDRGASLSGITINITSTKGDGNGEYPKSSQTGEHAVEQPDGPSTFDAEGVQIIAVDGSEERH